MKEQGLALVRDKEKYKDGDKLWEVILLDSSLTETWTSDIALENRYRMMGYEYATNFLYILFRAGESESDFLHLVQISLINHEINTFEIKHQFNLRLTHFSVVGNHAVLGGYVIREPAILLYEMSSNQVKVVPGFFLADFELLDLRVNVNNTFTSVLIERGKKEKKKLKVRTFDESGTLILETEIDIDQDKTVLAAQTSILKRDEMMILGSYGETYSKQAIGIFSVPIDPFNKQTIRYFDFAQLNHFLDYLPEKRANKIRTKSQRSREDGELPNFSLNLQPLRIEECEGGFILISEVYNPSGNLTPYPYWNNNYNQNGYYPYGFSSPSNRYYNSPYSTHNTQNSDYRIMETTAVLFDPKGKLVWDHSLKLPDVNVPVLEQIGDFILLENRAVIAYKRENEIYSKILSLTDLMAETDTTQIDLKSPTSDLRHDAKEEGGIRHWYGSTFYTWGNQSIRDRARETDQIRYVYYINKINAD
ncbi:MAG: hypothetical protein JJE09_09430 [Bacteroidia bacterium]|nr:hypothetical protein [Bacteroidia bacterium]